MKEYRNKDWLHQKYWTEGLSVHAIAKFANVSFDAIYKNMKRLGVERRKCGTHFRTEEINLKTSKSSVGRKPMLGKTHSDETKKKMSEKRQGESNSNWKGGKTLLVRSFRKSAKYREWRISVLERDKFCCQYEGCGEPCNVVHHIKPVKTNPELKLDLSNGMAVCEIHHKLIHKQMKNGEK